MTLARRLAPHPSAPAPVAPAPVAFAPVVAAPVAAAPLSVLILAGLAVLAALAGALRPAPAAAQLGRAVAVEPGPGGESGVIFLVRHAETEPDGTRDPALSAEGRARAERLAALLRDARLDRVLTSGYARTRATARAVADGAAEDGAAEDGAVADYETGAGLPVVEYDAFDLPGLAARLRGEGGRALVVGHSNTTPELVRLLGGDPGPPIGENEHDRLYMLIPGAGTPAVRTVVLRY